MDKLNTYKDISTNNSSGNKTREHYIKKTYGDEFYYDVKKINLLISFKEKLFLYLHSMDDIPKCECGNMVKFINFSKGYRDFCSKKCYGNSSFIKEKRKKNNLNKYGVEHTLQLKEVKEKIKKTNKKKYGVENPFKSNEIKEKIKQKIVKKYGVEHYSQTDDFKKKYKKHMLKTYDVEHYSQTDDFKKKYKATSLKKYGVENPNQCENIKNKKINNFDEKLIERIEKYGKYKVIEIFDEYVKIKYLVDGHVFIENRRFIINRLNQNIELSTQLLPFKQSNSEFEIKTFIGKLNIKNKKIRINNKEVDVYMPEHKIGIEFNGLYWHSDLFKDKNYHLDKTVECEKQNVKLIHIFEDEWMFKPEIVKSIIKTKLGLNENTIYGRKTKIREVSSKDSKEFLQNNHIQGNVNASIRLGLYYNHELVSLMTFGKKRKALGSSSEESEYEMYRFCNKLNTNVVGGASKLFKYFVNNHTPKSVLSFADRRYFDGNLYSKLGFDFVGETQPNYYYFKGLERHHRFKFRKDVLVKEGYDSSKTEKQIMIERGYYRIYDCGNLKYIFNTSL